MPPAEPDQRLAALLLHAARDIDRVETAFDAELLLSTLLGSVYAAATPTAGQRRTASSPLCGRIPSGQRSSAKCWRH